MSVQLKEFGSTVILADDLEDGQLAVITSWHGPDCVGDVVQRYGDHLVFIGIDSEDGEDFFNMERDEHLEVRLLQPQELIEVTDN